MEIRVEPLLLLVQWLPAISSKLTKISFLRVLLQKMQLEANVTSQVILSKL
jgi:hypothetical protein